MKTYYHDLFTFPLPEGHRFPIDKYVQLRERLVSEGVLSLEDLIVPQAASDEQLGLAHEWEYLEKVKNGQLSEREIRRMGFPWSPQLVERSRRSVGSSIAACRTALVEGLAANLAGGTHHAYPDHGEGFCVFNDVAVAARVIQKEKRAQRIVILDCDVHQGNGTAAIFAGDPTVFTFSIHGAKNFPFHKEVSDLDMALPDGAGDQEYLEALRKGLKISLGRAGGELAIYLAGADPFVGDRLGRLALTKTGLAQRDQMVLNACWSAGLPTAVVMAGGYAKNFIDTVDIHYQTISIAARMARQPQPGWRQAKPGSAQEGTYDNL
jgi:acetoin utilization deacetylase AcuC-like enzyme